MRCFLHNLINQYFSVCLQSRTNNPPSGSVPLIVPLPNQSYFNQSRNACAKISLTQRHRSVVPALKMCKWKEPSPSRWTHFRWQPGTTSGRRFIVNPGQGLRQRLAPLHPGGTLEQTLKLMNFSLPPHTWAPDQGWAHGALPVACFNVCSYIRSFGRRWKNAESSRRKWKTRSDKENKTHKKHKHEEEIS